MKVCVRDRKREKKWAVYVRRFFKQFYVRLIGLREIDKGRERERERKYLTYIQQGSRRPLHLCQNFDYELISLDRRCASHETRHYARDHKITSLITRYHPPLALGVCCCSLQVDTLVNSLQSAIRTSLSVTTTAQGPFADQ